MNVVGTIFTFSMITLWVRWLLFTKAPVADKLSALQAIVSVPTVKGAWQGSRVVFAAPCVSDFKLSQSTESAMEAMDKDDRPDSS